jgi:hypothetical protein
MGNVDASQPPFQRMGEHYYEILLFHSLSIRTAIPLVPEKYAAQRGYWVLEIGEKRM